MHQLRTTTLAALSALAVGLALAGPAAAFSAIDHQANSPEVANPNRFADSVTGVFPTNKQNEPSIAANGLHLVAGSNDEQEQPVCGPGTRRGPTAPANDCSFFPGVGTDGVYTSADGGGTWTNRGLLDDFGGWQASPFVSDGDPVIVYGPRYDAATKTFSTSETTAYYQSLASYKPGRQPGNQAPEHIVVSTSTDNGASWSGPSVIGVGHGNIFNDKNAIWADRNPTSPFFGRLYASWTQFRSIPGTAEPILTAYSTDGGRTWSTPRQLSGASNNRVTGGRQGSAIRSDGHGTVYVAWEDGGNQVYAVSRDGGVSYSRPKAIGPVTDLPGALPGANFRTDSFLSLAADPAAHSTTLYASWVNQTTDAQTGEVVVYKTSGGAWTKVATPYTGSVSGTGLPFFQGIDVSSTGRVDLGWQAMTAKDPGTTGTDNASIDAWYASSPSGVSAFAAPQKVSTKPSDPAASAQNNLQLQFWGDYNTLVSGSGTAWFIYTDSRNGTGCLAVDAYQRFLAGSGAKLVEEERGAAPRAEKAALVAGTKPAPQVDCPTPGFGNTDVVVSAVTP